MRSKRSERLGDALDRLALGVIERGAGCDIHTRRGDRRGADDSLDESASFELLEGVGRAAGGFEEGVSVDFGMLREILHDGAQSRCPRGQICQCILPPELRQSPIESFFAKWSAVSERDGHHRRKHFPDRMAIVIGGPAQELQENVIECRLAIEHRVNRAHFGSWNVRSLPVLEHDANDLPAPERYTYAGSRRRRKDIAWKPIVERPAQGSVDGDRDEHRAVIRES